MSRSSKPLWPMPPLPDQYGLDTHHPTLPRATLMYVEIDQCHNPREIHGPSQSNVNQAYSERLCDSNWNKVGARVWRDTNFRGPVRGYHVLKSSDPTGERRYLSWPRTSCEGSRGAVNYRGFRLKLT